MASTGNSTTREAVGSQGPQRRQPGPSTNTTQRTSPPVVARFTSKARLLPIDVLDSVLDRLNDAYYKALTNESTQEMLKETQAKPEHKKIIDELRGQLSIPENMTPEFVDEFRKYVVELCARELVPLYDSTTRSWKELPESVKLEVQDLREIANTMETRADQESVVMKAVFEDISKALAIRQERAARTNFVLNVLAVLIVLSFSTTLGTGMEDAREGSR